MFSRNTKDKTPTSHIGSQDKLNMDNAYIDKNGIVSLNLNSEDVQNRIKSQIQKIASLKQFAN
ncbi:hypothetical protein J3L16_05090 [Alteromonas sp. 5E99-2]|uniref:hypothetical protein n=1 Tax=Alteromonas sp. 5E99-2 TaxID=2817683 RepID=UPI001A99BBB3|nr:hypothetical protein [Alteromonas sp. 5E99-2]MBO1255064.1 hypothetical protein [Alteromonas sp. 5E99-2]